MHKLLSEIWLRVGKCYPTAFFSFSLLKKQYKEFLIGFDNGRGKGVEEGGSSLPATSDKQLAAAQGCEV